MSSRKVIFILTLSAVLFWSCSEKETTYDLLISNASVVDVQNNRIISNQLVGISGDTIGIVTSMEMADQFKGKDNIDLEGKYLMPGLWDMHVHFRGGDSLISENKDLLGLFLKYGVTTVRDAGGDMTPALLEWREQIESGILQGPDIFTSGPKFDGDEPSWAGSVEVTNKDEVTQGLDSLEAMGVDYIKNYDGNLEREVYYELIRQTEERGLKITGHMPMDANLLKAVEYGLDGMEHLYYALGVGSPLADSLAALGLRYGALSTLVETYDPDQARSVFEKIGQGEFYATPTLFIGKTLLEIPVVDHTQDSLLSSVGQGIQKTYLRRVRGAMNRTPEQQEFTRRMRQTFESMVVPMHESGINILAGSDCGAYNSFVYPGQSLIGELINLVEAGLAPQEALAASVINGPMFFGLKKKYGSVEPGKMGHLIWLEANPLADINNIRTVLGVIKSGKVLKN